MEKSFYSTSGQCGAVYCIVEMPNLKKVYETYKDVGFDVIAVSLDNEETELRDYIKENDIVATDLQRRRMATALSTTVWYYRYPRTVAY